MKTKAKKIKLGLSGINTCQFASIGNPPSPDTASEIRENIEFVFGASEADRLIGCMFRYSLLEGERLFLTIQVSCDFDIREEDWGKLLNNERRTLTLSKGFAQYLAEITVGTTRGILHSKTENTPLNKYPVGLVDFATIFSDDTVIPL